MENKYSYIIQISQKKKKSKENSIPPCWAGPLVRVYIENFHLTSVGSWKNQVRSHLGGLVYLSYEHIIFL